MLESNDANKFKSLYETNISKNQPTFNSQSEIKLEISTSSLGETFYNIISKLENINIHYLCPNCLNFPLIEFINEYDIKYNCGCLDRKKKDLAIQKLFNPKENYMIFDNINNNIKEENVGETYFNSQENNENINKDNIFKCNKHKSLKIHKFRYYCIQCHENACKECCQKHLDKSHELIVFDFKNAKTIEKLVEINEIINNKKKNLIMTNIEKEIDEIRGYKIQKNDKDIQKIPLDYLESFILLINIIMKDYKYYPNYSHIYNIENIHSFLINQIKNNSVCKIINKNNLGSGFFCYIPYDNKESRLTVLMTTNRVIGNEDIQNGKEIKIKYGKNYHSIKINSERKVFINERYDINITFIEIKSIDQIPNINYLEIEENLDIINKKENKLKKLFLLHYPYDYPKLDPCIILNQGKNSDIFEYNCSSENSSIGGALLSNNYRIIGVHRGKKTSENNKIDFSIKFFMEELLK